MATLRVLATFAVVFGHACSFFSGFGFTQWPNFPYVQNIAVTVFFAISGYTIAWICDTRSTGYGRQALIKFVFDRAVRLAVPLFPFIALCGVLETIWLGTNHPHPESLTVTSFIGNLLFLQWLAPAAFPLGVQPFGLNRPLWTLALEFWAYVIFAGIFFGCFRGGIRFLPVVASGLAAWIMGGALYGAQGSGLPLIWFLGAGLYFVMKATRPVDVWGRRAAFAFLGLTTGAMFWPDLWPADGGYSKVYNLLIFASFSSLVVFMSRDKSAAVPRYVPFFAGFAYSTYIVHYPILYALHLSGLLADGETSVLIGTVLAFVAGWIWGYLFERHYRAVRKWLWATTSKLKRTQIRSSVQ